MTFEAFLVLPETLANQIALAETQLMALEDGSKCSSPKNDGMPKSQPHRSWTEDYTILIDEKEQQVAKLKERQERAYAELGRLFSQLEDPRYINVLVDRYIHRMHYNDIATTRDYSIQHVYKLHSDGRRAAKKIYQKKESWIRAG